MKRFLFTFTFLLSFALCAQAQTQQQPADEFFHHSAGLYINSDLENAMQNVLQGLAQYPGNQNLLDLKKLIEEEQERQSQMPPQQQQQNDDSQEQEAEEKEAAEQNPEEQEVKPEEEYQPEEISLEEAEKILQALAQMEKELLKEFKKPKSITSEKHEKDW